MKKTILIITIFLAVCATSVFAEGLPASGVYTRPADIHSLLTGRYDGLEVRECILTSALGYDARGSLIEALLGLKITRVEVEYAHNKDTGKNYVALGIYKNYPDNSWSSAYFPSCALK